ncbi:MAG: hypothetical protein V3V61_00275 [Gammaproteobacteria bacterium]
MTDKRRENESFEQHKKRQKLEGLELKYFKRGRVVWNSLKHGTKKNDTTT